MNKKRTTQNLVILPKSWWYNAGFFFAGKKCMPKFAMMEKQSSCKQVAFFCGFIEHCCKTLKKIDKISGWFKRFCLLIYKSTIYMVSKNIRQKLMKPIPGN